MLQNAPQRAERTSQPFCQKLWPFLGHLCQTGRENKKNSFVSVFSPLHQEKILRWRWSYIPHFSHLRLPLCQEATGLILHGYSARPPRKQTVGVSGSGCLVGQVQDTHQQHTQESELSGAAVALQDGCVDLAAPPWQLQGKRKGNLLFSMWDDLTSPRPNQDREQHFFVLILKWPQGLGFVILQESCQKTTKILE